MNRYEIAIQQNSRVSPESLKIYRFRPSTRLNAIQECIRFCVKSNGIFDARNQPSSNLDSAVIAYGRAMGIPIIVENPEEAWAMSVAYSHKIYFKPPKGARTAICYGTVSEVHPHVIIIRPKDVKKSVPGE